MPVAGAVLEPNSVRCNQMGANMSAVVIIGGHGKIALRLARILSGRGDRVTSIIRDPQQSSDIVSAGAHPVVLDVEHCGLAEFAEALSGHDAVVWAAGAGGGDPARTDAVDRAAAIESMQAAQRAGVSRYVMVSYFGAGPDHGVPADSSFYPYAEAKSAADARLTASGLDATIVRPSRLTDESGSGAIDVNTVAAPLDKGEVSRDNVAEVIAAALVMPSTVGTIVEFNDGASPVEVALAAVAGGGAV